MRKLALFFTIAFMTAAVFANQKIVIASNGSETTQIGETILSVAYSNIGITAEFRSIPPARSFRAANDGTVDANVIRIKGANKDYPNLVMVPESIVSIDWVAVVTTGSDLTITSWEDLKPYNIVLRRGIKKTEAATAGMKVNFVNDYVQALKQVSGQRADVTVLPKVSALKEIKRNGLGNLKIVEPVLDSTPLFHYINVKHEALVSELADSIKAMKASGEFDRLTNDKIEELTQ